MDMVLRPQDILILLKLITLDGQGWTYASLAQDLSMSPSEVHAGVKRAVAAHLADPQNNLPIRSALDEFLMHGVKYAFPPDHGGLTRGIPTGFAAAPLIDMIAQPDEPPPVWPDPEGKVRGYEFSPLFKSVPKAAARDKKLYELLVLVDAIRGGRARERDIAVKELRARLKG